MICPGTGMTPSWFWDGFWGVKKWRQPTSLCTGVKIDPYHAMYLYHPITTLGVLEGRVLTYRFFDHAWQLPSARRTFRPSWVLGISFSSKSLGQKHRVRSPIQSQLTASQDHPPVLRLSRQFSAFLREPTPILWRILSLEILKQVDICPNKRHQKEQNHAHGPHGSARIPKITSKASMGW